MNKQMDGGTDCGTNLVEKNIGLKNIPGEKEENKGKRTGS